MLSLMLLVRIQRRLFFERFKRDSLMATALAAATLAAGLPAVLLNTGHHCIRWSASFAWNNSCILGNFPGSLTAQLNQPSSSFKRWAC